MNLDSLPSSLRPSYLLEKEGRQALETDENYNGKIEALPSTRALLSREWIG